MSAKDMKQLAMVVLLLLLLGFQGTQGTRVLNRCTLVLEMDAMGVPRDQLARWAYLAQIKSSYRTDAISPPDGNGNRYYGLFQIGDEYWCRSDSNPYGNNICNVDCKDLLSDNIKATVECAQLILGIEGWRAWCDDLPYPPPDSINYCFEHVPTVHSPNRTSESDPSGDRTSRGLQPIEQCLAPQAKVSKSELL